MPWMNGSLQDNFKEKIHKNTPSVDHQVMTYLTHYVQKRKGFIYRTSRKWQIFKIHAYGKEIGTWNDQLRIIQYIDNEHLGKEA